MKTILRFFFGLVLPPVALAGVSLVFLILITLFLLMFAGIAVLAILAWPVLPFLFALSDEDEFRAFLK